MKARYIAYRAFYYILAFALLGMGGIALIGYSGSSAPHALMLAPGSALALMLAGLVILMVARNCRRACWLSAGLLGVAALFSLALQSGLGSVIQQLPDTDPLRMRSALAIVLLVLAVAILGSLRGLVGRALSRAMGVVVAASGILSQLSYGWPVPESVRLGYSSEAATTIDLFVVLLGVAIWLLPRLQEACGERLDRRSLLVGLVGVLLTCMGGYLLSQQAAESAIRQSDQQLSRIQESTERLLAARLALVQRMAERWGTSSQLPSWRLWRQEARSYLRDFPSLQLIVVLDGDLQPRWIEDRGAEARARLQYFQTITAQHDWLRHVQADLQPHMSRVVPLDTPSHSVLIAAPLRLARQAVGFIVACLDITDALGRGLNEGLDGLIVHAYEGERLLFDSSGAYVQDRSIPISERVIPLHHDVSWRLVSYQSPEAMHAASFLPALVTFFGLGFSFFLMLSQRLAWLAREHASHLSQANQQLTASLQQQTSLEALNQRIMHFSLDVLCSIDEQGRFFQISPSCEAVFGYRPEEMIGQSFIDFVLPEDRESTLQVVREDMSIGGQGKPHFRNRYRHKEGHTVHVMWSAAWSAKDRSIFAIAHDITRLVQSEAFTQGQRDILEMVSTNQPLPTILDAICEMAEAHSPRAICSISLMDKEKKRLMQGAAPSLPADYSRAIHESPVGPEDGACGAASFYRTLSVTEDIATDPLWVDCRELALSHGLRACCSSPMLTHDGEVIGTFAIYQREAKAPDNEQLQLIDICGQLAAIAVERDRDRHSLQENEQRYRSLFAFNPNPVFSFDLAGNILSINQAGCDLSGYTEEELIGQNFSGHVLQEDLPRVMAHFQAVISGQPQRYEVKVHNRQGEVQEMDIASLPIVVDNRIVGVFGIGKDITERKVAEKALHATLKELERSNRELQDFAFVASHDLQEPLRKIRAFSERLEMRAAGLDDDARDYLSRMSSAAERMQALIRGLLAYSRLSTHGQAFAILDLNRILAEVLQDMEASLEASRAHVEYETLPPLQGDAVQIRQLLQNLISNAIKFHQEGQPPHVRVHAERTSQDEWTLCVSDRGIGFDEKYLDRIFNPFQRLHGRQAYAGTGIGLAIVKKIAERHGARISASSHPGQGATFRITFNIPSEGQAHAE